MIKPREIRDNILVQLLSPPSPIKLPTGIIKVVKLMGSEFKLYNIDKPVCSQEMGIILDIKMVTGIPITEKWILKFGFKKFYWGYSNLLIHFIIAEDAFSIGENIMLCKVETTFISNMKYIHQLQNLYFALKGEELTIKE